MSQLLKLAEELTDSQKNIRANATLYKARLAELPEADRLRLAQFAVTRCYLVVVATPDLDSAYRIFSVLNSRGLDLAPTDILNQRSSAAFRQASAMRTPRNGRTPKKTSAATHSRTSLATSEWSTGA